MAAPITKDTELEYCCEKLARIYQNIEPSKFPIYRWMHVVNDATILGEEIRRSRYDEALKRLSTTLGRFLEFIGHFLYVHRIQYNPKKDIMFNLSDLLALCFRRPSSRDPEGWEHQPETFTKWIVKKYPMSCGKCGGVPCECVLKPWIFEERREKPGPYQEYKKRVEINRTNLINGPWPTFTIKSVFQKFSKIYRNSFYHLDPWKTAMHLSEEMGEAITQLSRLELVVLLGTDNIIDNYINRIRKDTYHNLNQKVKKIKDSTIKRETRNSWNREYRSYFEELNNLKEDSKDWLESWGLEKPNTEFREELVCRLFFAELISDKLKEELADILSWIAALSYTLSSVMKKSDFTVLDALKENYSTEGRGRHEVSCCSWCKRMRCKIDCLVGHDLSAEIVEAVIKM